MNYAIIARTIRGLEDQVDSRRNELAEARRLGLNVEVTAWLEGHLNGLRVALDGLKTMDLASKASKAKEKAYPSLRTPKELEAVTV